MNVRPTACQAQRHFVSPRFRPTLLFVVWPICPSAPLHELGRFEFVIAKQHLSASALPTADADRGQLTRMPKKKEEGKGRRRTGKRKKLRRPFRPPPLPHSVSLIRISQTDPGASQIMDLSER